MRNGFFKNLIRGLRAVAYDLLGAKAVSKIYYRIRVGGKLDLKNPKTLNQKIQWLKLYYYPHNELATKCTDKYLVREYIKEKGYGECLNELYGVYDDARDIEWDKLPDTFVIKCNHGCAYNIICTDKSKLDKKSAERSLNGWLKKDFGKYNAEPHYSKIKPKIVIEKYLGTLTDYKFFCFNGKCRFYYVSKNMDTDHGEMAFFDKNGLAPFQSEDYKRLENPVIPDRIDEMQSISESLSKDFPLVRVDWYLVEGKMYFGELTFTPSGGIMDIQPKEYDLKLGKDLDISFIKKA